jgi:hypothetical protein
MMRNLRNITMGLTVMALVFLVILPVAGIPLLEAQHGTAGTGDAGLSSMAAPQPGLSQDQTGFRDTCTREGLDKCEAACTTSDGIFDEYCYEECIYTIC